MTFTTYIPELGNIQQQLGFSRINGENAIEEVRTALKEMETSKTIDEIKIITGKRCRIVVVLSV